MLSDAKSKNILHNMSHYHRVLNIKHHSEGEWEYVCTGTHVSLLLFFIILLFSLSFISSVLFFSALLFSLGHYDLLRQRGCVGSTPGHIIRALCFALYKHRNMIEPWVRRLFCTAQRKHYNPCSIVLTTAVNIMSRGLALKSLHADSKWI